MTNSKHKGRENECSVCLHKVHRSECQEIVMLNKNLQKKYKRKNDICGCW